MKKPAIIILILAGVLLTQLVFADKLFLSKTKEGADEVAKRVARSHPLIEKFNTPRDFDFNTRTTNKLLVIMVEFNDDELLEDDPNTTGLGKFIQDPGDYPITIGSPPHNYSYYMDNLQALNLYYRAASLYDEYSGLGFDLQYDLFPKPAEDGSFRAYTLQQPMKYYMPVDVDNSVTIARFEEYFQNCWQTADEDDEINFSEYDHFMIIHAGSDWQHDIESDTPSDIPSFFINIGDGKEVLVDDGSVVIDHACNVPETISQDFNVQNENEHYGYGAVNAVYAHEFGHSLGFVDLYNTRNYAPGVGYWDIMDSGGFGLSAYAVDDSLGNRDYYFVEGAWPTMPGAWHRVKTWEDQFKSRGILVDMEDLNLDEEINIKPSTSMPGAITDTPFFVRIKLDDSEEMIIENRQVDADGDGGASFKASLDRRVPMYPTPYNTDAADTTLTYEYDFLLPGWISTFQNFDGLDIYVGGGLVFWRVDQDVLDENNNYANNTVNIRHSRRGVHIVEADNIDDIGSIYSYFWRGTAYEPYTKYKPLFAEGQDHIFAGWDVQSTPGSDPLPTHNDELSSVSSPALYTNNGNPSLFKIYDISSYSYAENTERGMSFKIGSELFTKTEKIANFDSLYAIGYQGNTNFLPGQEEFSFPVISENAVNHITKLYDNSIDSWINFPADEQIRSDYPVFSLDWNNDGGVEFAFSDSNKIKLRSTTMSEDIEYNAEITSAPLFDELFGMVVPTAELLYYGDYTYDIPNAVCSFSNNGLVAYNETAIHFVNPLINHVPTTVAIPDPDLDYLPVSFIDSVNVQNSATFVQNNIGDIYRITEDGAVKIFELSNFSTAKPTQLALGEIVEGMIHLVFGAADYVYAITPNGTMANGFPAYIEEKTFQPAGHPVLVKLLDRITLLIPNVNMGYTALNAEGVIQPELSFAWENSQAPALFNRSQKSGRLYFNFADADNNMMSGYLDDLPTDPLIWNGYRNGGDYSLYRGSLSYQDSVTAELRGFAYPNPAGKNGEVRLRVFSAQDDITLKIFDIAGNIIYKNKYDKETGAYQELVWKISDISSGVYYGIIKSGGESITVPIAIEK